MNLTEEQLEQRLIELNSQLIEEKDLLESGEYNDYRETCESIGRLEGQISLIKELIK